MQEPSPVFLEPIRDQKLIEHFGKRLRDAERRRSNPGDRGARFWLKGTPREVLRRITTDDPLGVMTAASKCIDDEALFIEADRLCLRCLAIVAHRAPGYEPAMPLEVWVTERLKEAVIQLVNDDWDAVCVDLPVENTSESGYRWICEALEVDPPDARMICVVFNGLPRRVRRAFYCAFVLDIPLNEYVAQGNGPPSRVKTDIERALRAIAELRDPEAPDPRDDR